MTLIVYQSGYTYKTTISCEENKDELREIEERLITKRGHTISHPEPVNLL
jgi:hypothetical protein